MVQRELSTLGIICKYGHFRQATGRTRESPCTHPTLETNKQIIDLKYQPQIVSFEIKVHFNRLEGFEIYSKKKKKR